MEADAAPELIHLQVRNGLRKYPGRNIYNISGIGKSNSGPKTGEGSYELPKPSPSQKVREQQTGRTKEESDNSFKRRWNAKYREHNV